MNEVQNDNQKDTPERPQVETALAFDWPNNSVDVATEGSAPGDKVEGDTITQIEQILQEE